MSDDNPCYALVGLIAAEQSRIEHFLDAIIWNLSGIEAEVAACLTGQFTGLPARYSAIENLMRRRAMWDHYEGPMNKQLADDVLPVFRPRIS